MNIMVDFLDGNDLVVRGAVDAGCRFFAGYPITPVSSRMNGMVEALPRVEGIALEAEDEIAAIGFCIGASLAGMKAMTASSGPGLSLFSENIGLAVMLEVPLVIVVSQRQGPATGSATRTAQGDIQFIRWGTSGGMPVVALCPTTPAECYTLTLEAFHWAEALRFPVFLVMDRELSLTRERVDLAVLNRPTIREIGQACAIVPFHPLGGEILTRYTTSTHNEEGLLTTDPAVIQRQIDRFIAKIEGWREALTRVVFDRQEGADLLVISYGITARSARGPGDEYGAVPVGDRAYHRAGCGSGGGEQDGYDADLSGGDSGGVEIMDPGSFLNLDALPFPFCPGCGHGFILPRIDEALRLVDADPAKVVIVTDIGCVGLSDPYFRVHTLHGLHGRSVTYATGIKLARPDLHVLVLMGDGGMGIGGTHLLSAARRNIGITVLVFNNANFGMTGGQHSVTTPEEARTATTPLGNLETPLDICATLAPARPNFLARTHAYDPGLPRLIADGLSCNGFALLDIQEYCTAYFVRRNLSESEGLISLPASEGPVEVVRRDARPEFSRAYRVRYHGAPELAAKSVSGSGRGDPPIPPTPPVPTSSNTGYRLAVPPAYSHRLSRKTGIILAGGAGQKVRSAASLLGRGAILSGLFATQKDDYPITIMSGHSVSEILLSPDPIDYTGIDTPDILILLSEEGLKQAGRLIPAMTGDSWIYADDSLILPETRASVLRFPFHRTALKIDRSATSLIAVGALLARTGIIPREAMAQTIRDHVPGDRCAGTLAALEAGWGY
ncbi:MAG: 2-oxoacid:acceptor oxidoreductase family protein [Nitrospirae bacterium]|nr:2-oxoacid:acceptor oxidoreductase family protein [Nitrospirota bacterium]